MTNRFVLLFVVLLAGCGQGNEEVVVELIKDVERLDNTRASSEYVDERFDNQDSEMRRLEYEIKRLKAEIEHAQYACASRWPSGPVGTADEDQWVWTGSEWSYKRPGEREREGPAQCTISCINDTRCVCSSRNKGEEQ